MRNTGRNTNGHASKVEKLNKEKRTISHNVEYVDFSGETLKVIVPATCKTFSVPYIDENGNFLDSCKNCKESERTKSFCVIASNPEIQFASEKSPGVGKGNGTKKIVKRTSGKMTIQDFVGSCIKSGIYTRKEIINMFLANYPENNEMQGARYITSAFNPKYAIKRFGKLAAKKENGIVYFP